MGGSIERYLQQVGSTPRPALDDPTKPPSDPLARYRAAVEPDPQLQASVRQAGDADTAVRALRLRAKTGLPAAVVDRNLDALEKDAAVGDVDLRQSPKLAGWMAEDPHHAAVARDDLPHLSWLERQILSVSEAFTAGKATRDLSALGEKAIRGTITPEERTRVAALRTRMASAQTYGLGEHRNPVFATNGPLPGIIAQQGRIGESILNFLETLPAGVANQLPIQPSTTAGSVAGALIGGGAGLIAGAPTGPGAIATGLVGAGIGWKSGAVVQAGRMEAALAYLDYEDLRDDQGRPLARSTMLAAAGVVGAVNGALEGLFGTEAGHAVPGVRALGREQVRKALSQATTRKAFDHFASEVVKNAGEEGVTEFLQEYVTSWSGAIAKMVQDKAPLTTQTVLDRLLDPQYLTAALQSAKAGAQGGAGMAVVTGSAALYEDVQKVKRAERFATVLQQVGEGVKTSTLAARLPEAQRALVSRFTKDGPLEHVYADAEFFQSHFQGAGLAPEEVADELGVRASYDEALRTGGSVAIPFATYASTIAPSEHNAAFAEELRTSPTEFNAREAREFVKERNAADVKEAESVTVADASAERVQADVQRQLEAAGYAPDVAEPQAVLVRNLMRNATKIGQDPWEYYQSRPLTISRLEESATPKVGFVDVKALAARRTQAVAEKLSAQGKVEEEGVTRFAGSRTPAGARRAVAKVSTTGLLHELLDLEAKRADAETRAPYEVREDKSFATSGFPQIVSTKDKHGGPSRQAKAQQNLTDYDRISDEVFAELATRGLSQQDVFDRVEDARAALDERAALQGDIPVGGPDWEVTDDEGNALFQKARGAVVASVRPVEETAATEVAKVYHQTAFHGTPHRNFTEFSIHKIGSGEGAQAYGYGLYFAQRADIAQYYRETLAKRYGTEGRLFKVDVPEDDQLLHWDLPLRNQYPKVKEALQGLVRYGIRLRPEMTGEQAYKVISAIREQDGAFNGDEDASMMLSGAGVAGIKYLDALSRGKGKGTSNFVIFDHSLVRVRAYDQTSNQGPRGRIRIGEQAINIDLFKTADLSTFLHETGHFYAEVLRDMAQDPNATQQLREDFAALERHVGATPGEAWTREHHEVAARSFEAYLMDGKAPNQELRRAFAKFRAWLIHVYRQMQMLDVELTPEVRGVFNRMVATDEEIAAAQHEQRMAPLFADPASVGMPESVAARYQRDIADAQRAAEETLSSRLMTDLQREQQAWWKAERETTREAVQAELAEEPISRAQVALRRGTMPDGSPLPEVLAAALTTDGKPRKLDKASLVAKYGPEGLTPLKGLYAVAGGIPVEDAALLTGFPSGDALVQALANTAPFGQRVEQATDARMRETHGDLLTDGRLPVVAMEAVHTEKRAALLRSELEHLVSDHFATFKGLTKRIARRLPTLTTVRDQAEASIAAKPVREINPLLYQRAEAKAARGAMDLSLKGDWEGAFDQKLKELQAHEHYRAATAARAEVEKIVTYMRSFDKATTRQRIGKAGGDYLEQIDALRDQYSFRSVSLRQVDKNRSLLAFVREQERQGLEIDIPESLLGEAAKRNYKEVPLEELRGVRDAVQQVAHLAKVKNGLLASARARTMDEARSELIGAAGEHFDLTIRPEQGASPVKGLVRGLKKGFAAHTKMEFLFRHLDGHQPNGTWWTYFFKPMADAENQENAMRRTNAEALASIMGAYTKAERDDWHWGRYTIPGTETAKRDNQFTKSQILAVALNWGNEYNRGALMDGYGWTEGQVTSILKQLDDRDWRTVQAIWDHIDTYWPEAQKLEREVTGLSPEKVERSPFTAPNGLAIEGGYYPVAFDREQSSRQTALDLAADVSDMAKGYGAKAMTKHGHLKERTNTGGKPLKLELSVVTEHLSAVAHDLAFRRAVIDVAKLTRDREIQEAIEGAVGREMYQQLGPWLANIAGDRSAEPAHVMERIATRARNGNSVVALGFNVVSSVVQTLGYTLSVKELGAEYAARGMQAAYLNPTRIAASRDFVFERSAMMRDRTANFDREVRDMTRAGGGVDPNAFFKFIAFMDMGVSIPTWLGAYQKAMDGKLEHAEAGQEQAAIDYADSVVRMTQAAGGAKDLAAVQRGNAVVKLFTAFYSSMAVQFNQYASIGQEFAQTKNYGRLITSAALVWFLPAVLEDVLRGRGPGDDDDPVAWAGRKLLLYPFSSIVFLRDFANAAERYAETGRTEFPDTAIGTMGDSILKLMGAMADELHGEESTRADYQNAANAVGIVGQLPTRQTFKTLEVWYEALNGGVEITGPFDFLWKSATGIPKDQR